MKIRTLQDLIARLRANPQVVGLVRYGGRSADDMSAGGDFDLFVFLHQRSTDLESIHFYLGDIPVDLNLRTLDDLSRDQPISPIDLALSSGEILWDPTKTLTQVLPSLQQRWNPQTAPLTEHDIHFNRFCQQHLLDKVKNRLRTEPLLCQFLLATNIYWLVQTYFHLRSIPYPGEKKALEWLEAQDSKIHQFIRQFYQLSDLSAKLAISEQLTDLVLAPIDRGWKKGEILAFGLDSNVVGIEAKAQQLFTELLE